MVLSLIENDADMNIDFEYHGKSWKNREVSPIIKAIELANTSHTNQNLFNPVIKKMISKGACINKIGDNPSPLLVAYNPSGIISASSRLRNPEIFSFLLKQPGINPFEYDIMETDHFKELGGRAKAEPYKAFQLLAYIDADLRSFPPDRTDIKDLFFNPLFNKLESQLEEKSNLLREKRNASLSTPITQAEIESRIELGTLLSSVHRYYNFNTPEDFFKLILNNDMILIKNTLFEKARSNKFGLIENRCTVALDDCPTQMYHSRKSYAQSGMFFKAEHTVLIAQADQDLFSWSNEVAFYNPNRDALVAPDIHNDRKLLTSYCIDLEQKFRVAVTSSEAHIRKRREDEARRRGELKESSRSNELLSEQFLRRTNDSFFTPEELSKFSKDQLEELNRIKSDFRSYKGHFFFNKWGATLGIYHSETIAHLLAPDGILDFEDVHLFANIPEQEKEKYAKQHYSKYARMNRYMLDLHALQKQRQHFNLTGETLPILRASAKESHPRLIQIDQIKSLQKLISVLVEHNTDMSNFVPNHFSMFSKIRIISDLKILSTLDISASPKAIRELKNPHELLLWSLELGFSEFSSYLIKSGINFDNINDGFLSSLDTVNRKSLNVVLKRTIQTGHIEEARFLMRSGAKISDTDLTALETQFSEDYYNYKHLFHPELFAIDLCKCSLHYKKDLFM